ncbi:MAG: glycosyltransferase, partial [Thermoanaerobaculia bacterium]
LMPLAAAIGRPVLFIWGIDAWKPPEQRLFAAAMKRCRAVVAISECTRSRFLGWSGFAGPTHVLPNAIHLEDYGVRPRRLDLAARLGIEGRRCLLTVGRLETRERYKGFDEVMEVLGDLPPDVVYLLAGDGNDRPRLEAKAASLGLADRVVFTGRFSDEEKADLYGLADAYVMPGRGEGFGFVVLEALASGLPVVGSKIDGTREALREGELGLLVDPTNPAEVRAAITEVLRPRERVVPAGIAYFSFDRFAARTRELVASIGMRS